jgi:hypothetical protein
MVETMKDISFLMPKANWVQPNIDRVEGIVLHYAAGKDVAPKYHTEKALIRILRSYANWHIGNKKVNNDSLAYTYVVDKWGNVYQTRDDITHSHHTGTYWGNTKTIGILCPLGTYEHPTAVQVQSVFTFVDNLCNTYSLGKNAVYGHKELSNTPCPGELYPYILQYREGTIIVENQSKPIEVDTEVSGWYVVPEGLTATIRALPQRGNNIIIALPSGYKEYIHGITNGQYIGESNTWYITKSDYGTGYIHSSGIFKWKKQ